MHTTKWSWIGGNYIAARQLKAWSTYMRHVWGAKMKQWWKHTPPTHVARVQLPESTPYSMWVKFVVDSLPCSERFLSRYSNFPLSSKPNTSKFQFDLERKDTLNSYVLQFGFNFFFFSVIAENKPHAICLSQDSFAYNESRHDSYPQFSRSPLYRNAWDHARHCLLHKFSNICKPEEGWYGQAKYCYKKTIHVVMNQFSSSLWASHFGQTDEKKRLHF